jgi:uncharacterized delta-60 repeat protein
MLLLGIGLALASPGSLDPGFSGSGLLSLSVGDYGSAALAVARQTDGKLVLAGWATFKPNPEGATDFAVVRVSPDGTPDSTFSTDGIASVDFAGSDDYALAVIQQRDGKLVLAGRASRPNGTEDIALARFNANGTLDATFGDGGKVTLDIGGSHDLARGLIQQSDGKLVIAGGAVSGSDYHFVLARFDVDGTLDTTFGVGGTTLVDFGGGSDYSWADGLALQQDGKFVAVGRVGQYQPFGLTVGVARVTTNGRLDPSFSGDGLLTVDVSGTSEQAFAVAVRPDDVIVVAGSSVPAGGNELQTLLLRVNPRTGGSMGAVSVRYATVDGSAVAGEDFRFATGTLSWAHGEIGAKSIGVVILTDQVIEADEELQIRLSNPTGKATIPASGGTHTVRILNDDRSVRLASTGLTADEAGGSITLAVMRVGSLVGAVSVDYATSSATATAGSDFTSKRETLNWSNGDSASKTITVEITNDMIDEADEVFTVRLSNPSAGTTLDSNSVARITIADDDAPGGGGSGATLALAATASTVSEGGSIVLGVNRSGSSSGAVSVDYATLSGTATAGSDFTAAVDTLHWADGDSASKSITVHITSDTADESDETFTVRLSNPSTGATLGPNATATVRITDDDPSSGPGRLGFLDAGTLHSVAEGNGAIHVAVFRSNGSTGQVSMDYQTIAETATPGVDFTAKSDTVTWGDGETGVKFIDVDISADDVAESDETFRIRLSNPTGGATIVGSEVQVKIRDDDSADATPEVALASTELTVNEADGSVVLTVGRSSAAVGAVSVDYATSNGTATAASDFASAASTLHWADGDSASKSITVNVTNDGADEGDETFTVSLSNPLGAALGSNSTATVTITDDDPPIDEGSGGGGSGDRLFLLGLLLMGVARSRVMRRRLGPTRRPLHPAVLRVPVHPTCRFMTCAAHCTTGRTRGETIRSASS